MDIDDSSHSLPPESSQLNTVNAIVPAPKLTSNPVETITFDQDSDLSLLVGTNPHLHVMLIDSRALCRASPVFRKMLRGSFVERQPTNGEGWVVKLPEDKPKAIAALCDLCHGQTRRTLRDPSFPTIYDIVVAADKYDMIRCLRPVTRRWIDLCYPLLHRSTSMGTMFKLLLVAEHLGDVDLMKKLMGGIANYVGLDPTGNLISGKRPRPVEDHVEATLFDVLGAIKEQRAGKLDIIYKHCHALGNNLLDLKERTCAAQVHRLTHEDPRVCKERVCGNVLMLASSYGILPFFIPGLRSDASLTVSKILVQLDSIQKSLVELPICNQ